MIVATVPAVVAFVGLCCRCFVVVTVGNVCVFVVVVVVVISKISIFPSLTPLQSEPWSLVSTLTWMKK